MNEPIGTVGILEARARADHRVGDGAHRLVLPDDALVQVLLEIEELLALALHELRDRNAGPARHHLGDVLLVDLFLHEAALAAFLDLALLLGGELLLELGELAVLELGDLVQVVLALAPSRSRAASARSARAAGELADAALLAAPTARASGRSRRAARPAPSRVLEALARRRVGLLLSASRSISSCMTRRETSSSSAGIESISVRSFAAASSTRSIALSGRKRSVM